MKKKKTKEYTSIKFQPTGIKKIRSNNKQTEKKVELPFKIIK